MKVKNQLSPYDIERGFISKLIETKDMNYVLDQQIKADFFSGENQNVYRFILDYFAEHSDVPSARYVKRKFPHYRLEVGAEESLNHWCAELRKKVKHNRMADLLEEMSRELGRENAEKVLGKIKKGIYEIERETEISTDVDVKQNTESRKEAYLRREENKGMLGISYGIKQLDYYTKGLENGTLTTLIAKTGVGKTTMQVLTGANAMLNGYKVLHFLTEMSENIMRDRYEAMLYGMTYGAFNYSKFKSGELSTKEKEAYFDFLENTLPTLDGSLTLCTATDVPSVLAKAEATKADLIMIDSAYLMNDVHGARDDWLRVAHITRDLKKGAKRLKKPIFINHQADKSTSKQGPELENISFSQALGQDSDTVLGMYRDEVMRSDKEMGIKVLKNREGFLGKVHMIWDFTIMKFDGIYSTGEGNNQTSNSSSDERVDIVQKGVRKK